MTIEEIEDKYFRGFNCGDLVESLLAIAKRQREALEKIESLSLCYEGDECGSKQIASEALKLAGKEGE